MSTLAKGLAFTALIAALAVAYNAYKKHEAKSLCSSIQNGEPVAAAIQKAQEQGFDYNKNLYDQEADVSVLMFYGGVGHRCVVEIRDGKVRDKNATVRD